MSDSSGRVVRAFFEGLALLAAVCFAGYYAVSGRSTADNPVPRVISVQAETARPPAPPPRPEPETPPLDPEPTTEPVAAPASLEDVISTAMPALVRVETTTGFGSGFFVKPDTILTNNHVVGGNTFVGVKRRDGQTVQAHVDATAPEYDLAVLRIPTADPMQPVLTMGSALHARAGQDVVALGTPLGLQNTVTRGIVSALRQVGPVALVQTDAAINPGNSGGPMLNRNGQVVAIATMTVRPGAGQGLSFGVAIDHARALMDGRLSTTSTASTGSPSGGLNQLLATPPAAPAQSDDVREQGARAFAIASAQLARIADSLDDRWRSFVSVCYRGQVAGNFDRPWFAVFDSSAMRGTIPTGCDASFSDIRQTATRIRQEVETAEEAARRAGVYPGTRREILQRHRLAYLAR